jgi:hypothetical protein
MHIPAEARPFSELPGLLRAALADAGIQERNCILFLVDGEPPLVGEPPKRAAEYAYLAPSGLPAGELNNAVLRDAYPMLDSYTNLHRFASYTSIPDAPRGAVAVGLRHETEHAAQWERLGHALTELESILREAMRRAGDLARYGSIPSEREANRAAYAYGVAIGADVEAMRTDERFCQFVEAAAEVDDLWAEMVAMLWTYVREPEIDDQDNAKRPFGEVIPELTRQAAAWGRPAANDLPDRAPGQSLERWVEPGEGKQ